MKKRKNILFLFPDQHRGDWLPGLDGSLPLHMDHLRQLMAQGTTFTRAVTNSPLCAPARACLATGQSYEACGVWNNNFCCPLDRPTVYRRLRDAGYQVGTVGKSDLHKPVMYWGKDGWIPQLGRLGFTRAMDSEGKWDGFWASCEGDRGPYGAFLRREGLLEAHWRDYVRRYYDHMDTRPTRLPQAAYADDWVTESALAFLRDFSRQEGPWFMMVNFSGPHDPWDVTEEMKERWRDAELPTPADCQGDPAEVLEVRRNYAAMLENIDHSIGRLLDLLRESGQDEDTVILYSADHGEMLGDRGRYYKSVPYGPSIHIPLVICGGSARKGAVCRHLVQLSDLAATITEIAGTSMPEGVDSHSLLGMAAEEDAPPVRDHLHSALYPSIPQDESSFGGYEDRSACVKNMGGAERINSFNERLGLPVRPVPAVKKEKQRDWRCVVTERCKFIEYLDPVEHELYDLNTDPGEKTDLSDRLPEVVERLRRELPQLPTQLAKSM